MCTVQDFMVVGRGGGVGVEEAGIMGFKRTGTMALRGKGLLQ